jgi:N-dimethylarginine dimethylaminohydrolase
VGHLLDVGTASLELVDPRFYHLDTCFCPLDSGNVLIVREAFSPASLRLIYELVPNPIEVPLEVGLGFACNGMVVGKQVVSAQSIASISDSLAECGYVPVPLPMSEFMKSGGGVRCLTLPLPPLRRGTARKVSPPRSRGSTRRSRGRGPSAVGGETSS